MEAINHIELQGLVDFFKVFEGAELQKISGPLNLLHFHFWKEGVKVLSLSCFSQKPFVLYAEDKSLLSESYKKRTEERPISIFIKAHFLKERVKEVRVHKSHSRIIEIEFENSGVLEMRLFSGGGNLGAHIKGKSVYLRKPQVLRPEEVNSYKPDLVRTPQVIFEQALESLESLQKNKENVSSVEDKLLIAKEKIEKVLNDLKKEKFKKFAQALESGEELSSDLRPLYKDNLSMRENIEWAFKQSKVTGQKIKRLEDRLKNLALSFKAPEPLSKNKKKLVPKAVIYRLSDKVTLRCGRSARENIDLLRHAKPWHLWMHLSDYPSGHLIIDMPKGEKLSAKELERSAQFLFLRGAPKKLLNSPTQKFAVMYTECRYVKTQKKQKGLVTAQKHQTMTLVWKSEYLHAF